MFIGKLKCATLLLLGVAALLTSTAGTLYHAGGSRRAVAETPVKERIEPAAIPADQFAKLHALIKPQPGELRFHEIPWLIDVWEARKKAAAEGKPILVWCGAGGSPLGVC
jgi:hypothetical protein